MDLKTLMKFSNAIDFNEKLQQRDVCLVSQRNNRYLLYALGNVSVLNQNGFESWQQFKDPTTPYEAIQQLAKTYTLTKKSLDNFLNLLNILLEKRFLQICSSTIEVSSAPVIPVTQSKALSDIYIHITNQCNLHCRYCYNFDYRMNESVNNDWSIKDLYRLIDQAKKLSVKRVVFTGGEPLLKNTCIKAAKYARSLDISTSCLTNGTLLAKKVGAIGDAFDNVIVSIDSWHSEEQEFLRPGVKLKTIVKGIRKLADCSSCEVWLRPVITRFNLESLPDFPFYAIEKLHCKKFKLALCSPTSVNNLDIITDFLPSPDDYQRVLRDFNKSVAAIKGSSSCEAAPFKTNGGCGAGTGLLSVAPNGDIYPCQCLHIPEMYAGNLHQQSLKDIWTYGKPLQKLRSQNTPRFKVCGSCSIADICSLSCLAIHRAFNKFENQFTARMCTLSMAEAEEQLWNGVDATLSTEQNQL